MQEVAPALIELEIEGAGLPPLRGVSAGLPINAFPTTDTLAGNEGRVLRTGELVK